MGILPVASWRGSYVDGSYTSGAAVPSTTFDWPARTRDVYLAPDGGGHAVIANGWLGSLIDSKLDQSGLVYLRNRYYDPKAGRFTQEDPIGLAGGTNLYGFASGDPVTYSDPFGLCGKRGEDPCPSTLTEALLQTGRLLQPVEGYLAAGGYAVMGLAAAPFAAEGIGAEVLGLGATLRSGAGRGIVTAGAVAQEVASATGGTVRALQASPGFRVTADASRAVVARIKSTGDMRVSIDGLGSLTREGVISSNRAATHLSNLSTRDLIDLVAIALQRVHVP